MDVIHTILQRRSIRHFTPQKIEEEKLSTLKEIVRYYPSAANRQPLKFTLLQGPEEVIPIFHLLRWASYISDYTVPVEHSPNALFLIWGDKGIASDCQFAAGSAATELMLAAHSLGLSSCCLGVTSKTELHKITGIDSKRFEFQCLLALGYSTQTSCVIDLQESCKYQQDESGNFIVPKRKLSELFLPTQPMNYE